MKTTNFLFPIVLHKDRGSDYGVTVPDLPGCFSAGRTLDEAMSMAQEAIELHLEGLIEDGLPIPKRRDLELHKANRDFRGGAWAVVSVDVSRVGNRAKRVNITLPERLLRAIDGFARASGSTRSGLLAEAVTAYMAMQRSAGSMRNGAAQSRRNGRRRRS